MRRHCRSTQIRCCRYVVERGAHAQAVDAWDAMAEDLGECLFRSCPLCSGAVELDGLSVFGINECEVECVLCGCRLTLFNGNFRELAALWNKRVGA